MCERSKYGERNGRGEGTVPYSFAVDARVPRRGHKKPRREGGEGKRATLVAVTKNQKPYLGNFSFPEKEGVGLSF